MATNQATANHFKHVLRKENFGGLILNKQDMSYALINRSAADMLLACQDKPYMHILNDMHDKPATRQFAKNFLEDALRKGWINDLGLSSEIYFKDNDKDLLAGSNYLSAPVTMWIEVTNACNLSCRHCFLSAEANSKKADPKAEELYSYFTSLAKWGVMSCTITGGEPLMREDIVDIVKKADAKFHAVTLVTNGMRLTPGLADSLLQCGNLTVVVSLNGDNAAHEAVCGYGSFEQTIKGVRYLLDAGVSTSINVTMTKPLFNHIDELLSTIKSLGIAAFSAKPLRPLGRAKKNTDLAPSKQELYSMIMEIKEKASRYGLDANVESQIPALPSTGSNLCDSNNDSFFETSKIKTTGCSGANTLAGIRCDSAMLPCGFLFPSLDEPLLYLSQYEDKLTAIKNIWHTHPVFTQTRSFEAADECIDCSYFKKCRGGCHANSKALGGSPAGIDPLCFFNDTTYGKKVINPGVFNDNI